MTLSPGTQRFEQVKAELTNSIVKGQFAPGDRLPSLAVAREKARASRRCVKRPPFQPQLAFTRPGIDVHWGMPLFRTQKELGGRALVSDTFSNGFNQEVLGKRYSARRIEDTRLLAGYGIFCHGEGYNVLYGDGSANWHGDPQQRIVWHAQGKDASATDNSDGANHYYLPGNSMFRGANDHGAPFTTEYGVSSADKANWKWSSAKVWHDFHVAARMDVFE